MRRLNAGLRSQIRNRQATIALIDATIQLNMAIFPMRGEVKEAFPSVGRRVSVGTQ